MKESILLAFLLFVLAAQISAALDDRELARRIRDGDHQAFKQFFDRYHATLMGYLQRKGLTGEAAQDIVQNAFIWVWDHRETIEPQKSLRALLFRIGYTRMLNFHRDHAKFERHEELSTLTASRAGSPEYSMIREKLMEAMAALPERRRAVFELCFLEEMTYRETAEALEISVKTVENQMSHALKAVRAALADYRS